MVRAGGDPKIWAEYFGAVVWTASEFVLIVFSFLVYPIFFNKI